jgi:hypothetical protein
MSIVHPQFTGPISQDVICFGPFRLSATERLLEKGGYPVQLGSRALDILIALVERPARSGQQEGADRKSVAGPFGR